MDLKEQIRRSIFSYGADLCGFASVERLYEAPDGFRPADIYSGCKTVISFAIALPKGLLTIHSRLIYGHYNAMSCSQADMVAFKAAKKLEEDYSCLAIPMPSDGPYEYWNSESMEGKGLLSMKHIAVQAGLGCVGKNSLFMNQRYGNMVTLGAILTDMEMVSDELSQPLCIEGCQRCINSCPVKAIQDGHVNQKLCRQNAYGKTKRGFDTVDCNICRAVCPVNIAGWNT